MGKLHAVPVEWLPEFAAFEFEVGRDRAVISVFDRPLDRLLHDKTPFLPEQRLAKQAKGPTVSVIDTSKLELGDIVLSTTTQFESTLIQWATRGRSAMPRSTSAEAFSSRPSARACAKRT